MNPSDESIYYYWLYNIEGTGPKTREKLIKRYGSPKNVFQYAAISDLLELGISQKNSERIINSRKLEIVIKNMNNLYQKGIRIITLADEEYPDKLRHIYDAPGVLYVRGGLPKEQTLSIAVVGARECSNYGKELAIHFAKKLAECGVQIISGLAKGIDSFAHLGARSCQGKTYAVMGCGIDQCYPRENINLYMDILESGGVISEYPPGYRPLKANFPMRNRIISGLSDGILLVEAREKSGSLGTMDHGLEQGKNIYACPGRIFDALSLGTNHMIQMGGKLVLEPKDILEDYGMEKLLAGKNLKKNYYMLEKEEKIVYDGLSLMPKHIEEIINETGYSVEFASNVLMSLKMKGAIRQTGGNYFARTVLED